MYIQKDYHAVTNILKARSNNPFEFRCTYIFKQIRKKLFSYNIWGRETKETNLGIIQRTN